MLGSFNGWLGLWQSLCDLVSGGESVKKESGHQVEDKAERERSNLNTKFPI